jgi:hypothetical protein
MAVSRLTRQLLHMQGYRGLPEPVLEEVAVWARLGPAVCTGWVIVALLLQSAWLMLAGAGLAFFAAFTPWHPIDSLYNHLIRRITGTGPLPPPALQRRFACAVGFVWLLLLTWLFASGRLTAGYVMGFLFILAAAPMALAHYCIASHLWVRFIERPRPAGSPSPTQRADRR